MKLLSRNPTPGEMFYIPAMDKNGEYGLVISRYIDPPASSTGHLIEVFSKFYVTPPQSIDDVDTKNRLFRPILCDLYFKHISKWRALFTDPNYDKSMSGYEHIALGFDTEIWKGGAMLKATKEQLQTVEEATWWRTHHVVLRVNTHLAEILCSDEPYDYSRLPIEWRVDTRGVLDKIYSLATVMDERMKTWSKKAKS